MDLIVAVYDHWGIGKDGTQPVALAADRKFFRETTQGAAVIVGRKTLLDFPNGAPLPKRLNIVLTRQDLQIPGATVCGSYEEAARIAQQQARSFVIGGGSVYRAMLPMCSRAIVTKVHCSPDCDTFFPNLDEDPDWEVQEVLASGWENEIFYEMIVYTKKK